MDRSLGHWLALASSTTTPCHPRPTSAHAHNARAFHAIQLHAMHATASSCVESYLLQLIWTICSSQASSGIVLRPRSLFFIPLPLH
jgi:hypothetical protein